MADTFEQFLVDEGLDPSFYYDVVRSINREMRKDTPSIIYIEEKLRVIQNEWMPLLKKWMGRVE